MYKLFHTVKNLVISARPFQWLKNMSLYAAITFGGSFFNFPIFIKVTKAVIVFCGISSAMYLINDIFDAQKDKRHPLKKSRPIASGRLDKKIAVFFSLSLLILLLPLAYKLAKFFFALCLLYVIVQLTYSLLLRNVIIIDALTVALGFIFRVYAGALVVNAPISSWLILATIGLSLLLAFGKRRSEGTLLKISGIKDETRKTLRQYPDTLLDSMISMAASLTVISYVLFTFQTSPTETIIPLMEFLPTTLTKPKWMMLTIPLVIYGVARYLFVIYEKKEGESPEKVLLSDYPLLMTILIWITSIVTIVYGIGS